MRVHEPLALERAQVRGHVEAGPLQHRCDLLHAQRPLAAGDDLEEPKVRQRNGGEVRRDGQRLTTVDGGGQRQGLLRRFATELTPRHGGAALEQLLRALHVALHVGQAHAGPVERLVERLRLQRLLHPQAGRAELALGLQTLGVALEGLQVEHRHALPFERQPVHESRSGHVLQAREELTLVVGHGALGVAVGQGTLERRQIRACRQLDGGALLHQPRLGPGQLAQFVERLPNARELPNAPQELRHLLALETGAVRRQQRQQRHALAGRWRHFLALPLEAGAAEEPRL